MCFNAPRMQQSVHIKKKILEGACPQTPLGSSRLRRSIAKFHFFLTKPNPMPEISVNISFSLMKQFNLFPITKGMLTQI